MRTSRRPKRSASLLIRKGFTRSCGPPAGSLWPAADSNMLQTIIVLRYSVNENRFCSTPEKRLYICICNAVTQKAVEQCAEDGARCVEDLTAQLGGGAGCGRCLECAGDFLRQACCNKRELAAA